ncbi:MAG: hypothetical protein HZB50_06500 [Chloroflexi bacterium]|nr:hypothetical protein [Chloroflexota bacterium]
MKTIKTKAIKISERLLDFFIKWRRVFFIPFFFVLVLMEIGEMKTGEPIHSFELLIYFSLLITIALLVELLLRANRLQNRTVKTLDYKNQINRVIIAQEDWETLADSLVERLTLMADVKGTQLFLWENVTQDFSLLSQWAEGKGNESQALDLPCQNCMKEWAKSAKITFESCRNTADGSLSSELRAYCLPVYYQEEIFALVRFILGTDQRFTSDQIKIFGHLGDEIAIALTAGQDRKRLLELQITQAALAERQSVSQYLHDSLSQNIGYLNMKLEQFSLNPALLQESNAVSEIHHMKETAEKSYSIVRSKLEDIHSDTTSTLDGYVREHARRISERAGFEFTVTIRGNPKPISMDVQRAVFYVFQEALSNVEKHAKALKVDIVLSWGRDKLLLTICDNGIGFNPKSVNPYKHFGLGIVRERMSIVNGRIEVNSMEKSGTIIKISAPFASTSKRGWIT